MWTTQLKTIARNQPFLTMETIINNPGLEHLAENIFLNLNYEYLKKCHLINKSAGQILDNPMFWIQELFRKGLSKENQKDWIESIQSETISGKKKHIAAYLKWNLKKKHLFDLPCYTKIDVQEEFRRTIRYKSWRRNENTEIVKILAPLTDNANAPDKEGWTPIRWATHCGR